MFEKFPKIGQFRNVVKDVKLLQNGTNNVVKFTGTVKLHGTNAAVGLDSDGNLWAQSRNNVITPESDNAGFAQYVSENERTFRDLVAFAYTEFTKARATEWKALVYGEWCGGNIQKGVALSELNEKIFVIFAVEFSTADGHSVSVPVDQFAESYTFGNTEFLQQLNDLGVYFITQAPTYSVEIDFDNPGLVQNKLAEITEAVENECPFAKEVFGISGIGEGVVWTTDAGHRSVIFKVKGQKHSVSKVKKIATVDPEVVESISKFVDYAVTENRLNQGLQEVGLDQKFVGQYIGWVSRDINQEESDVLEANGLTMKQVGKQVAAKARNFYLNKLNEV